MERELPENPDVIFGQPPLVKWSSFDHKPKHHRVYVAVAMIGGVTDIEFEIFENGSSVRIFYNWPATVFKAEELFQDEIRGENRNGRFDIEHPKIHSFMSALMEADMNEIPRSFVYIRLPMQVQLDHSTWNKKAISKSNGARIVLLEFKGVQESKFLFPAAP